MAARQNGSHYITRVSEVGHYFPRDATHAH